MKQSNIRKRNNSNPARQISVNKNNTYHNTCYTPIKTSNIWCNSSLLYNPSKNAMEQISSPNFPKATTNRFNSSSIHQPTDKNIFKIATERSYNPKDTLLSDQKAATTERGNLTTKASLFQKTSYQNFNKTPTDLNLINFNENLSHSKIKKSALQFSKSHIGKQPDQISIENHRSMMSRNSVSQSFNLNNHGSAPHISTFSKSMISKAQNILDESCLPTNYINNYQMELDNQTECLDKRDFDKISEVENYDNRLIGNFQNELRDIEKLDITKECWTRIGGVDILREKMLKPIALKRFEYNSYKTNTKDKLYPIKIRVFSESDQIHIAISFNKQPDWGRNDMMVYGKSLIIPPKFRSLDERNLMYISIFSVGKLEGHVGIAFKATRMHENPIKKKRGCTTLETLYEETQRMLIDLWDLPENFVEEAEEYIKNERIEAEYRQHDSIVKSQILDNVNQKIQKTNANQSRSLLPGNRLDTMDTIALENDDFKSKDAQIDMNGLNDNSCTDNPGRSFLRLLNFSDSDMSTSKAKTFMMRKSSSDMQKHRMNDFAQERSQMEMLRSSFRLETPGLAGKKSQNKQKQGNNISLSNVIEAKENEEISMNQSNKKIYFGDFLDSAFLKTNDNMKHEDSSEGMDQKKRASCFSRNQPKFLVKGDQGSNTQNQNNDDDTSDDDENTVIKNVVLNNLENMYSKVDDGFVDQNNAKKAMYNYAYTRKKDFLIQKVDEEVISSLYGLIPDSTQKKNENSKVTKKQIKVSKVKKMNPMEVNKAIINYWVDYKNHNIARKTIFKQIQTETAKEKRLFFLKQKIQKANVFIQQNETNRKEREATIQQVIDYSIKFTIKRTWFIFIIYYIKQLISIKEKFWEKRSNMYQESLKMFFRRKIQIYLKKRYVWRLGFNRGKSTGMAIKGGLALYATMVKEKVRNTNTRLHVSWHLPRFVRVMRVKGLCDQFVQSRLSWRRKVTAHMKNVKKNWDEFSRTWDKNTLTLMSYEEALRGTPVYDQIDFSGHLPLISLDFKKKLFRVIYNARLIKFLQARFQEGERTRAERKHAAEEKLKKKDNDDSTQKSLSDLSVGFNKEDLTINQCHGDSNMYIPKNFDQFEEVEKPFRLRDVIKFPKTTELLKQDRLFPVYFESIIRWDSKHYENLFDITNSIRLSKISKNKAVLGKSLQKSQQTPKKIQEPLFVTINSDNISDIDSKPLTPKTRETMRRVTNLFQINNKKFALDLPAEFYWTLILTAQEFVKKFNIDDIKMDLPYDLEDNDLLKNNAINLALSINFDDDPQVKLLKTNSTAEKDGMPMAPRNNKKKVRVEKAKSKMMPTESNSEGFHLENKKQITYSIGEFLLENNKVEQLNHFGNDSADKSSSSRSKKGRSKTNLGIENSAKKVVKKSMHGM